MSTIMRNTSFAVGNRVHVPQTLYVRGGNPELDLPEQFARLDIILFLQWWFGGFLFLALLSILSLLIGQR